MMSDQEQAENGFELPVWEEGPHGAQRIAETAHAGYEVYENLTKPIGFDPQLAEFGWGGLDPTLAAQVGASPSASPLAAAGDAVEGVSGFSKAFGAAGILGGLIEGGEGLYEGFGEGRWDKGAPDLLAGSLGIGAGVEGMVGETAVAGVIGEGAAAALGPAAALVGLAALGNKSEVWSDDEHKDRTSIGWAADNTSALADSWGESAGTIGTIAGDVVGGIGYGTAAAVADVGLGAWDAGKAVVSGVGSLMSW
jgi:hypothetical protein